MEPIIYLDNNATTPLDPVVLDAMLPYLRGQFGNAASPHRLGREARAAVERARQAVAELIGARSGRIVFTASATEANNLALFGLLGDRHARCHAVTSTIEHKSVLEPLHRLETQGAVRVTWLAPQSTGRVDAARLEAALTDDARLVSLFAAHNVIHTLNPIAEMAAACRRHAALMHCDATQWVGKLPLDVEQCGLDAVSISAHKFYGPKGAAALYLSPRALAAGLSPQIVGGGQEEGFRSGTLNVPAIVGFGAACDLAGQRQADDAPHLRSLATRLLEGLTRQQIDFTLNGHAEDRLPGGLHLTFPGIDSQALIASLPDVALSAGSACETDRDPDYVLKALGRAGAAHHSIRCQIGRTNTAAEIDRAAGLIAAAVRRLRAFRVESALNQS